MPYCTLQNLIDRFGEDELIQLSDKDNIGSINETTVDRAIEDADSLINGYLGSRYPTPLTTVPTSISRVACDIARYHLYDDIAIDHVEKRYEDAIKLLKDIAKGIVSIGVTDQGEKPTSQNTVTFESGGNVFSRKDKSFL